MILNLEWEIRMLNQSLERMIDSDVFKDISWEVRERSKSHA